MRSSVSARQRSATALVHRAAPRRTTGRSISRRLAARPTRAAARSLEQCPHVSDKAGSSQHGPVQPHAAGLWRAVQPCSPRKPRPAVGRPPDRSRASPCRRAQELDHGRTSGRVGAPLRRIKCFFTADVGRGPYPAGLVLSMGGVFPREFPWQMVKRAICRRDRGRPSLSRTDSRRRRRLDEADLAAHVGPLIQRRATTRT